MPTNQTIVFSAVNQVEFVETAMPEPAAGQVVVKTVVSSISSGTERALLTGECNINIGAAKVAEVPTYPRWPGYSAAGVIAAVGEGVTSVDVGDRVAIIDTGHQLYEATDVKNVFKIEDHVSFQEAALWHIATFPLAAIRKCQLEIGESAIVMGQGVLGMIAVKLLHVAGATPIIAVDPVPEKRQWALENGADYALNPFDPEFAATVKKITGGGAKVGIEVTGIGQGLDGILDCMARFGRVALLGCTRKSDFTIDYYRKVHGPGITLVGAHTNARPKQESYHGWWTRWDDEKALRALHQSCRIEFASMVSEIHKIADYKEVYHRLATEKSFPVIQFDWSDLA